jgi:hypothetical protein
MMVDLYQRTVLKASLLQSNRLPASASTQFENRNPAHPKTGAQSTFISDISNILYVLLFEAAQAGRDRINLVDRRSSYATQALVGCSDDLIVKRCGRTNRSVLLTLFLVCIQKTRDSKTFYTASV